MIQTKDESIVEHASVIQHSVSIKQATSKERVAVLLTTIDNPFDPSAQFDKWRNFDEEKGYYTVNYLDRIAKTTEDMSDSEFLDELERAIDEICNLNVLGIYKKVIIFEK
jgi:hypothetical protein